MGNDPSPGVLITTHPENYRSSKDVGHFNKIFRNVAIDIKKAKWGCDEENNWIFYVGNTPCYWWEHLKNDDLTKKYANNETSVKVIKPEILTGGVKLVWSDNLVCYKKIQGELPFHDDIRDYSAEVNSNPEFLRWGDPQITTAKGIIHSSQGAYRVIGLFVPYTSSLVDDESMYSKITSNGSTHETDKTFEYKLAQWKVKNDKPLTRRTMNALSAEQVYSLVGGNSATMARWQEIIERNPNFFVQYYERIIGKGAESFRKHMIQLTIPYVVMKGNPIKSFAAKDFPDTSGAMRTAIMEFQQGNTFISTYMYGATGYGVRRFQSAESSGHLCFAELIYNFFKESSKNIHDNYDIFLRIANLHGNNGHVHSDDYYAKIKLAFDGLMDLYCGSSYKSDAEGVLRCACIASKTDERYTSAAHAYPTCFNDNCSKSGYKFDDPNRGSCASYCNASINVNATGVAILKNISIAQNCMNIGNGETGGVDYGVVMNNVTDALIKDATDALKAYVFAHLYTKQELIDGLSENDIKTKLAVNISYHDGIVKEIDDIIALTEVHPTKGTALKEILVEIGTAREAAKSAVTFYLDTGKFRSDDAENETLFQQSNSELIRKTGVIQSLLDSVEKLLIEARDYMTRVYTPDRNAIMDKIMAIIGPHKASGGDMTTIEILVNSIKISNVSLATIEETYRKIKKIADDHQVELKKRAEEATSKAASRAAEPETASGSASGSEATSKAGSEAASEAARLRVPAYVPAYTEDETEVVNTHIDPLPKKNTDDGWSQWVIWLIVAIVVLFVVGLIGGIAIFSMKKTPKLVPTVQV